MKPIKPRRAHRAGDVIDVGVGHNLREHVLDEKMHSRGPVLTIFCHLHNKDCLPFQKEIIDLALMCQDDPKVVRVDCLFDDEMCDLFINHNDIQKDEFPLVTMITSKYVHIWEGELKAEVIYNGFAKDNNYLKSEQTLGAKGDFTDQIIESGRKRIIAKLMEDEMKTKPQDHLYIRVFDTIFSDYLVEVIRMTFWCVGCDWWHKNSKIAAFILLFFIPLGIALYQFVKVCIIKEKKVPVEEKKKE